MLQLQTKSPQTFPVGLDPTKTFFIDGNGNPCFALGEDGAELMPSLLKADIEVYLSDRVQRGVNTIWIQSLENILGSSPPQNANGDLPFTGGVDFVNPNNTYWNYIDYCMQRCLANGITVVFNPMFYGLNSSSGYFTSITGSSDAVLQTFAAFLGARYKSFPNIIWLMGGDADPNDSAGYAKINTFATALKTADPGHLMTIEASRFKEVANGGGSAPNGGYSSIDAHTIAYGSIQSWLDINWVYQTQPTCLSGSQRCYTQGRPCLLGEAWYELENGPISILNLRGQAYFSILGGCTLGHLFGNGAIWSFNLGGTQSGTPWKGQLASTGSLDFQRFGKLFRSRAWHKLVPDLSNVVMTVGSAGGSACARTSDGQTIIAYLPSSQTITIDMSKITDAGSTNCNWYNPQTGAVTNIGNFANSGTKNFTSPDSNDWVLVIDSTAANLRVPGT